jgi:hypothetical protein
MARIFREILSPHPIASVFDQPRQPVAQICNLPYRRFSIGRTATGSGASTIADALQNEILRYGRYKSALHLDPSKPCERISRRSSFSATWVPQSFRPLITHTRLTLQTPDFGRIIAGMMLTSPTQFRHSTVSEKARWESRMATRASEVKIASMSQLANENAADKGQRFSTRIGA